MQEFEQRFREISENSLRITFARGYYDHYDPDPEAFIDIPLHEELCQIPQSLRETYIQPTGQERDIYNIGVGSIVFRLRPKSYYDSHLMQLRWIAERSEWVGLTYGQRALASEDHYEWYYGPYSLDDYCRERLLEAYDIPTSHMGFLLRNHLQLQAADSSEHFAKVSPERLKVIGDYEQGYTFSLGFEVEGVEGVTWAADWNFGGGGKWSLSSKEWSTFSRWYIEGELPMAQKADAAYKGLLIAFGLSAKEYTIEQIAQMSPRKLAEVGTKDPHSQTMGDIRKASEVREQSFMPSDRT